MFRHPFTTQASCLIVLHSPDPAIKPQAGRIPVFLSTQQKGRFYNQTQSNRRPVPVGHSDVAWKP